VSHELPEAFGVETAARDEAVEEVPERRTRLEGKMLPNVGKRSCETAGVPHRFHLTLLAKGGVLAKVRCWMEVGNSTEVLENQPPAIGNSHLAFDQHSALSIQHSALSNQHSAFSTQQSALSIQHSAFSTQHSALSNQQFANNPRPK